MPPTLRSWRGLLSSTINSLPVILWPGRCTTSPGRQILVLLPVLITSRLTDLVATHFAAVSSIFASTTVALTGAVALTPAHVPSALRYTAAPRMLQTASVRARFLVSAPVLPLFPHVGPPSSDRLRQSAASPLDLVAPVSHTN